MTVEDYSHFVGCAAWQDLHACEEHSRAQLRTEPDPDRQMLLAQDVRTAQKAKHRHEGTCPACLQIESAMEQEGAA
jgi:hypothetical protein